MKNIKYIFLFTLIVSTIQAQVGITGSLGIGYPYQWRGSSLVDGTVLSPDITVGVDETGLSFNAWGAFAKGYNEIDLTLAWGYDINNHWEIEIMTIGYLYPSEVFSYTIEPSVSVTSYNFPLAPSLVVAYDMTLESFYGELSVSNNFGLPVDLGINYGLYSDVLGVSYHITLSLVSEFNVGAISIVPSMGYVLNLSDGDNVPFVNIILGI